jgi:hypothetical protein
VSERTITRWRLAWDDSNTPAPGTRRPDHRWQEDALCPQVGPTFFHPEPNQPADEAKRVCGACPVLLDCREYALAHPELRGIWGGLTTRQRTALRSKQAAS